MFLPVTSTSAARLVAPSVGYDFTRKQSCEQGVVITYRERSTWSVDDTRASDIRIMITIAAGNIRVRKSARSTPTTKLNHGEPPWSRERYRIRGALPEDYGLS